MSSETLSRKQAITIAAVAAAVSLSAGIASSHYFVIQGAAADGFATRAATAGILIYAAFGAALLTVPLSGLVIMAAGHFSRIAAGVPPALWSMGAIVMKASNPAYSQEITAGIPVHLPPTLTEPGAIAAAMSVGILAGTWYSIATFRPNSKMDPRRRITWQMPRLLTIPAFQRRLPPTDADAKP